MHRMDVNYLFSMDIVLIHFRKLSIRLYTCSFKEYHLYVQT